jgi:uncharacterized membrane protein YGL010W
VTTNPGGTLYAIAATGFVGCPGSTTTTTTEGKRPALVDNVFQIFIAPLFVLFEVLFKLGIRLELRDLAEKKLKEKKMEWAN